MTGIDLALTALTALAALVAVAFAVAATIDAHRARLAARRAHERADRWLDPRSRPSAHRKAAP